MASITYGNVKKYRHLGQDEEGPEHSQSETLRQRILKELLQKQLSKHVSVEQQLYNKKKFVRAACEESVTANTSGLSSFEDFRSVESHLSVKQTLQSCGLTDYEIQLLLNEESHNSALEAPHARRQRLEAIQDKLLLHRGQEAPDLTLSDDSFNCHQEEGKGLPVPEEAQQSTPHQDFLPKGHPLNHLKEIAEELFPTQKANQTQLEEHTARKRQPSEALGPAKPKKDKKDSSSCIYLSEKPKSYWDMQQIPKVMQSTTKHLSAPFPLPPGNCSTITTTHTDNTLLHITLKNNNVKVDHTKPFIMTLDSEDLIPLATIKANRKTIQELKEMEKFTNYDKGTPSRTLYIKNLSPSVCPKDLASLMGHFESSQGPKILYRLLGGRMKGQAFVTFPDETAASNALTLCTGYMLHGRPLVAVFGNKA